MKHKKERMYMAYMIQQHPQQISTESLAHQKRKSVADKSSRCEASSFFLPSFCIPLNGFNKINGGICFRHHDKDDKNPHFHFLANVVLDDGTRANLANIGKAAKEASISVTEKWGLTPANHRKRMQADDKKDTDKNENRTAEIHNHRHQNYAKWNNNPASNEDTNSDFTASNDRETATSSICGNMMKGIAELIIQPTVARIGTGSGSSDNTLDHDKNKNKQRKGGRRR